ncbi:MAG: hypothetical protein AB7O67_21880 [Vicinamibacterales bacterium]
MRWVVGLALAVGSLGLPQPLCAQPLPAERASGPDGSPLWTSNPILADSLARVARGSDLWRQALASLVRSDRRAIILTPDQVVVSDQPDGQDSRPFDPGVIAEVSPVVGEGARVDTVLVVVNLPLLQQLHDRAGSLPAELESDLDRILVHELYGHAFPYLLAGDLSGRCADPGPRERAADACAIRRENAVRAELGLGRRVDHGVEGLALARRHY